MEIDVGRATTRSRSWRNLKELLASRSIGCCGATWRLKSIPAIAARTEHSDSERDHVQEQGVIIEGTSVAAAAEEGQGTMNLAAALAAERQLRATRDHGPVAGPAGAAERVSLMRLLMEEAAEGGGGGGGGGEGNDRVCCVCMARKKGAAFIPCGHTFCRVCSREIWVNRGTCALCNRPINEILDIY